MLRCFNSRPISLTFLSISMVACASVGDPRPTRRVGKMVCTQPGQNLSKEQKFAVNAQLSQIITVGGGVDIGAKAAKEAKATGRAEEIDIWTFKLCEAVGLGIIEKKHYREFLAQVILGGIPKALDSAAPLNSSPPAAGSPADVGAAVAKENSPMLDGPRLASSVRLLNSELKPLYKRVPSLRDAVEAKDYLLAQNFLKAKMKKDASDPEFLFGLGEMHFRSKKYEKAKEFFARVKNLQPSRAMAYTRLGETLEKRGDVQKAVLIYTEALNYFKNALKKDQDDAALMFGLAEAQYGLRQWIDASRTYGKVIQKDPSFARAYLRQGWILFDLGKLDRAHSLYQKGLGLQKIQPKKLERNLK